MFHLEGLTCMKAQERHGALAHLITPTKDFLGGPVVKNPPANAADMGSIPGLGRFHMPQGNWAHACGHLEPACHNYCSP